MGGIAKKVTVEERLDSSMHITGNGASLKYREITERPEKEVDARTDKKACHQRAAPAKDHPWRKGRKPVNDKWAWANDYY